jgi:hypothetical protein
VLDLLVYFLFLIGIDVQLSGKTDLITLVIIIIREIAFLKEIDMYRIRKKKNIQLKKKKKRKEAKKKEFYHWTKAR